MQANLTIKGRVQGVFFRSNAMEQANNLKLTGWVKNNPEGTVSACVQGPEQTIRQFIEWCKKGHSSAKVESISVDWVNQPSENFTKFEIRH